eukprot:403358152
MATCQDLSYIYDHRGWQQRVQKELIAKANFENVLIDNMSEIEGNHGKVSFPGGAIRPQLQAHTSFNTLKNQKMTFSNSTNQLQTLKSQSAINMASSQPQHTSNPKNYFLINSSYLQASNPNSMRDLGKMKGILDLQVMMNQYPETQTAIRTQTSNNFHVTQQKARPQSSNTYGSKSNQNQRFQKQQNLMGNTQQSYNTPLGQRKSSYQDQYSQLNYSEDPRAKALFQNIQDRRTISTKKAKDIKDQKEKGRVFDSDAKLWTFRYRSKTMKVNEIFKDVPGSQYEQMRQTINYENSNNNQWDQSERKFKSKHQYEQTPQRISMRAQKLPQNFHNEDGQSNFNRTQNFQNSDEIRSRISGMSQERLFELKQNRAMKKDAALSFRAMSRGTPSVLSQSQNNQSGLNKSQQRFIGTTSIPNAKTIFAIAKQNNNSSNYKMRTIPVKNISNNNYNYQDNMSSVSAHQTSRFLDREQQKSQLKLQNTFKNKSLQHLMTLAHQ